MACSVRRGSSAHLRRSKCSSDSPLHSEQQAFMDESCHLLSAKVSSDCDGGCHLQVLRCFAMCFLGLYHDLNRERRQPLYFSCVSSCGDSGDGRHFAMA